VAKTVRWADLVSNLGRFGGTRKNLGPQKARFERRVVEERIRCKNPTEAQVKSKMGVAGLLKYRDLLAQNPARAEYYLKTIGL